MRKTTRKMWAAAAGVTGIALLATACSSDAGTEGEDEPSEGGNITLTVATFNEFGYTDEMFDEYEASHPGVTIEHKKAATSNEARENLNTRLAAGSGLSDIEAIEVDWLPELLQYPDKFVDLTDPELDGRWLGWKQAQATAPSGELIGYGTDIGPEAIAYRADLFTAAGLPADRAEVAALLSENGGGWDQYFKVGKQYTDATGKPWFDSAGAIWQGMINQIEAPYENPDDNSIIATENADVKAAYDAVVQASVGDNLSAHLQQWSDDWNAAFQGENAFATMLAPGWMLGVIEGNSAGVTGWDIADVFPGGAGNWGGSFLTVPAQGANTEAAKELAAWLTAPEQQLKAYASKGTFPSQVEAQKSPDLLGSTNEFFNNAPAGEILVNRSEGITEVYKGPNFFAVNDAFNNALVEVDVNGGDPAAQWESAIQAINALG